MNAAPLSAEDRTIFFIGGQGKSGTTWVQLLLDAHPDISCRGEAHFFDRLAPAMNGAFAKYRRQLQENNALFRELADSTRKEIAVSEGAQLTRLGYPPD